MVPSEIIVKGELLLLPWVGKILDATTGSILGGILFICGVGGVSLLLEKMDIDFFYLIGQN
jgi:hypothetical protein